MVAVGKILKHGAIPQLPWKTPTDKIKIPLPPQRNQNTYAS